MDSNLLGISRWRGKKNTIYFIYCNDLCKNRKKFEKTRYWEQTIIRTGKGEWSDTAFFISLLSILAFFPINLL